MHAVLKAIRKVDNPPITNKPVHKHDCDTCEFLGSVNHNKYNYDLYYHDSENDALKTFIARYGNDGKYDSGLMFVNRNPMLALAFARKIVKDYSN